MSMMPEVRVRLSPALYEQLMEHAAALQREPEEVVAEAVERWLKVQEEDVETRLRRALERSGLLVRWGSKPSNPESLERERQRARQILAKLTTPLSEDIIQERESSW